MNILFRTDASFQIGAGHAMRCFALAQALDKSGHNAIFAMSETLESFQTLLRENGFQMISIEAQAGSDCDAQNTLKQAEKLACGWIVLDGYHFDGAFQAAIKSTGKKLLTIDDYAHADFYHADILVNQNIYANAGMYPRRNDACKLLLGTRYALLRREFWPEAVPRTPIPSFPPQRFRGDKLRRESIDFARLIDSRRSLSPRRQGRNDVKNDVFGQPQAGAFNILVTMGGSDPENVTLKVVQAIGLLSTDSVEVVVVAGGGYAYLDQLQEAVATIPQKIRIIQNASNMPELMRRADLAVAAGGGACWELARFGAPMILLTFAHNQIPVAEGLHKAGIALNLADFHNVSPANIAHKIEFLLHSPDRGEKMSAAGKKLVDGRGASRVTKEMVKNEIKLRRVTEADSELLWQWVNDPAVRKASFNQEPVSWKGHSRWLAQKLADTNCIHYLAGNGAAEPVGQIRFDIIDDCAEIDISIECKKRGESYGAILLEASIEKLLSEYPVRRLDAFVKPENRGSISVFRQAGFVEKGEKSVQNHRAVYLTKDGLHDVK